VSLTGPDSDAVRAVIREVLAELLPTAASSGPAQPAAAQPAQGGPTAARPAAAQPAPAQPVPAPQPVSRAAPAQPGLAYPVSEDAQSVETVSLRTDADLSAFVRRLLHLFENPKHRDELRSGRLRFRLAPAAQPGSAQPAHRVDKGAATEAMVSDAAKAGARLVLGRRAVLTPLARDRARAAGVEIERER
jgi:hypothetical protein